MDNINLTLSKETKIVNPYGAMSQMYHDELEKVQRDKLEEFVTAYVKPIETIAKFKSQSN